MKIPTVLCNNRQWVCWRYGSAGNGDTPERRPYCPNNGLKAKLDDPGTWGTYEEACQAREKNGYAGIGYVFSKKDLFIGIEVERCYDPETGTFNDMAQAIMKRQPTYTEFLPSGTGIHMIFTGEKPARCCQNLADGIRMVVYGQYFAMTGDRVPGTSDMILPDNGATAWIKDTYIKPANKKKNPDGIPEGEAPTIVKGVPIAEYKGQYYRIKEEDSYPITNFVIRPVEMIASEDEMQLSANFETVNGRIIPINCMTSDLSSLQKFKTVLNSKTIALSFTGRDMDLEYLKEYLTALDWPQKRGVKALGIYDQEGKMVFVSGNWAIDSAGNSAEGIVQLEKYKSIKSSITECHPIDREKLMALGSLLVSYNERDKTVPILAWAAGCFLKEHFRISGIKFPHLFLIGEAGSGKSTTLERVLLPIFSSDRIIAASQATAFTLMKEAASSNVIPLPIDEFKPSKIDKTRLAVLYNHFRDSYDGHDGIRGRADQSIVTYCLSAPLIVAGEESASEAAIRERTVELLFSKKDLQNSIYRMAFNLLISQGDSLSRFGRTLLEKALGTSPDVARSWWQEGMERINPELPSRIVNNLACCYAGLRFLESVCEGFSLSFADVFTIDVRSCIAHLESAAKNYLLDGSVHNRSVVEETLEIMARMPYGLGFTTRIEKGKLYLCLSRLYDLYTKYRKECAITGEVLELKQFQKQLEHSEYFIQKNAQKYFGGTNHKCWVIDYSLLQKRCDVTGFEER